VPNKISNDYSIIKLDLDTNIDRRQVKLKRPSSAISRLSATSRLGKATWGTDKNKTIELLQQSEGSNDKIHELDNQSLWKGNSENIYKQMARDNIVNFRVCENEKEQEICIEED